MISLMLVVVKEAGFIAEEMFRDLTARQRWIRALVPKAEAYAKNEGLMLRGRPIVKFSKFPAGESPLPNSREVLVLCIYEKKSEAAAAFSSSAD